VVKTKQINIRINEYDLEKLRERSLQEGIPYQTIILSVLHKYITNQFYEERDILQAMRLLIKRK